MLLKLETGGYYDVATGREIGVVTTRDGKHRVVVKNSGHTVERAIQSGYASPEEAQEALDSLMAPEDVLTIEPPAPIEEATDDDETKEGGE